MNPIDSQSTNLAEILARLASRTQTVENDTVADSNGNAPSSGTATGNDSLQITSSDNAATLDVAAREIAVQNRYSVIADSTAALNATYGAAGVLAGGGQDALSAQANVNPESAVGLLSGS